MFTIEKKIQLQYKTLLWGKQDVYGIQWKPKKYIHNRGVPFESNRKENFKKVFVEMLISFNCFIGWNAKFQRHPHGGI